MSESLKRYFIFSAMIVFTMGYTAPTFAWTNLIKYLQGRHQLCKWASENWSEAYRRCTTSDPQNPDCAVCKQICEIENRYDCYQEPDQDPSDPHYKPDQLNCDEMCKPFTGEE